MSKQLIVLCMTVIGLSIVAGCNHLPQDTTIHTTNIVTRSTNQPSTQTGQTLVRDPALDYLNLPTGLTITTYAQVPNARSMAVVSTGNQTYVFVGNRTASSVYVTIDNTSDNIVDEVIELVSGLNSPNGVAYLSGDLYIAEVSRIIVIRDVLNHLDDAQTEVVFDELPDDAQHGWKYIAFGPDGDLYIPVGAPCNNCVSDSPYASLYQLDLSTKEFTLVAQGIRNTVGFARHPDNQELWFTDNGRDRMGDNIPTDELNRITQTGQHFGYPYCHAGDVADDTYTDRSCSEFVPPAAKLGPHVAALGMIFSDTASLPPERANHVLIAEHGSWNRSDKIGYRISAVDLDTNQYKVFIDGRLQNGDEVKGRPVDIKTLPDGSLLISDDDQGMIYRVQRNQ